MCDISIYFCNIHKKTLEIYVWNSWDTCNIRLKQLNTYNIRQKYPKTLEIHCKNICTSRSTFATSRWNTCNIRMKHLKHLKHTLATCMLCNIQIYFCNIQMKRLKHLRHLKHMLATWNICLQHAYIAIETYATTRWNTWTHTSETFETWHRRRPPCGGIAVTSKRRSSAVESEEGGRQAAQRSGERKDGAK
jgi:hypothetical protein